VGSAAARTWNLATRRELALKAGTGVERGLMLKTGAAGRTDTVWKAAISKCLPRLLEREVLARLFRVECLYYSNTGR